MILLQRQATVASAAKFAEALAFSDQVTKHLRAKFPEKEITQWLQVGGVFATVHWTVKYNDMADFEATMGAAMLDLEYQTMVAQASDCWLPGTVTDTLMSSL